MMKKNFDGFKILNVLKTRKSAYLKIRQNSTKNDDDNDDDEKKK